MNLWNIIIIFHDSTIANINYDITKNCIEVVINVYWSGEPSKKEDGSLDTHKTKVRVLFNKIHECNNKTLSYFKDVNEAYLKYIYLEGKEYICFADDETNPSVYIISDGMMVEELTFSSNEK